MRADCPGCENEVTQTFEVEGLDCATEVALVESRLGRLEGVCSVRASAATGRAVVVHTLPAGRVEAALAEVGLRARQARDAAAGAGSAWGTLAALGLALAGLALTLLGRREDVVLYGAAIGVGGLPLARRGWARVRQGVLDMNALMTVAVLGAMAIGEWGEGAATVVLFSLAQVLEARSLERARRAITGLLTLAPETARVRRGTEEAVVPAGSVARGETIVVGPGERVPLDGLVEAGISAVDQSPLTGESQPLAKGPADSVFAGSINGPGSLTVRVTRAAGETTLARVLRRVEEAQASRARSQGFVEAFARVYTPVVLAVAVLTAALPPLFFGGDAAVWLYRALVLLVLSCPCALVISTPVSIVSALTAASRGGVLVKGGVHLEELGRVRAVAFDKTGTLTQGTPSVTDVLAVKADPEVVLALAAAVEIRSPHPLAAAVVAHARSRGLLFEPAEDATEIPGRGARGRVGDAMVLVGSHRLFDERGLCDHRLDGELRRLEEEGKTAVLVGREDGERALLGAVAVADTLREDAGPAVAALKRDGVQVALLSGDNERTAAALADHLQIADRRADLLPEDKVAHVHALEARYGPVAMVGDGVNDAPALAAATVGIAMGRKGTDVALETADVALLGDDLRRIPQALRLGRRTRTVVRQNVVVSLGVKAAVLVAALLGHASLWAAVGADVGASLLVIGNGLRLLRAFRD